MIRFHRGQCLELLLLIALAIGVTVLFAVTPADVAAARLFYRPASADHWPLALQTPWSVLYRAASWITASLVLAGLGGLAVGLVRRQAVAILAALGGVAVLIAVFATPHGTHLAAEISFSSLPTSPRVFEVTARRANIDITLIEAPPAGVSITGELHGFGLPTSRLAAHSTFVARPVPALHYEVEQRGWFTDLDGVLSIRLVPAELSRIVVRVERGNIRVTDLTRGSVVSRGALRLDLKTAAGHIQQPGSTPPDAINAPPSAPSSRSRRSLCRCTSE